ncbi:hypothetical protein [Pedobacter gandavensis]|uniref:Uncharacterized protein n=1 Tax=Pedobacter gandavensis TaxID=2679963 RepID=A0ABR6ESD7_9SPHI|nr:hypothetical protein [Pedobacter gandavensis]MBB2148180.1 hypothetical protein [Pedobacter gandavensis]
MAKDKKLVDKVYVNDVEADLVADEQFSIENNTGNDLVEDRFKDFEFVNKHTKTLKEFIVNDEINIVDINKLAELNGISFFIPIGWRSLLISLVKELDESGWDREVSCIKEKFAQLRFHADQADEDIIEKYEQLSEITCETCGGKGKIRYDTWNYVACRAHYLENRGLVLVEAGGFRISETYFQWSDVVSMEFEGLDLKEDFHRYLKIKVKNEVQIQCNLAYNPFNIYKESIGYGEFLKQIPGNYRELNYEYINRYYSEAAYCEICGYKAVYNQQCECCEAETWLSYSKGSVYREKVEYLTYAQGNWVKDNGEFYASKQDQYPKNPDHRIL